MQTIDLINTIDNMTLANIEAELLSIVKVKQEIEETDFIVVDIFCLDCNFKTNFDIKTQSEIENYICPNCNSDNINKFLTYPFLRVHYL